MKRLSICNDAVRWQLITMRSKLSQHLWPNLTSGTKRGTRPNKSPSPKDKTIALCALSNCRVSANEAATGQVAQWIKLTSKRNSCTQNVSSGGDLVDSGRQSSLSDSRCQMMRLTMGNEWCDDCATLAS